jgi:Holliday junction resolvase
MNKREVGKKLEQYVATKLTEIGIQARPTKNSGASTQLGDILNSVFLCECKKRNTKNITVKEDVWNKLMSELPINSKRIPLYILENKNNKRWAVLDFNDFCELIKVK